MLSLSARQLNLGMSDSGFASLLETGNRKLETCLGSPNLFNLLDKRRHYIEQISDHPKVGDLKDGRFRILIDRDDRPRALHADDVLDSAANAEREVKLG